MKIEKAIETQQKLITNWEQRIQELEEVIKKYPWGRDGLEYDFEDWRETELKRRKEKIKIALITISALEKQLNGGWIPVSERLPEKEDIYQVTIKYKNFAGIHLTVRTAIYENKKWNIHGPQPVISNIKIIAWQPLPEPYKEEENE